MKGSAKTGQPARPSAEPIPRAPTPVARLEEVFSQFQDELVGMVYHLLGNLEDARDVVQDAFVKCWQRRDQLDEVHSLKAWVFQVTINAGRDLRGSAWRRKKEALSEPLQQQLADHDPGPSITAQRREEWNRLRQAIGELRAEEKEVFLLRENADLTYEQVGEVLGIPVGTVKTRMRMALAHLRQHMGIDETREQPGG